MADDKTFRILIVDDEVSVRGILKEFLSEAGYTVETAESGEEALDLIRRSEFHVVLTDIRMAGMSGIDLIRHIRAVRTGTEVVVMTSHASVETAVEAMRLGAYDYMVKPFEDLDTVLALVKRTIEKVQLVRENQNLLENLQEKNRELEKLNNAIRELAIRDGLTGLYNYRYFQEALHLEAARSERYNRTMCVLMIDVDHFKKYNDKHGHVLGDEVLGGLGLILSESIQDTGVVARYGGEEFVVILPETTKDHAVKVAEEIRGRVENHAFPQRETQAAHKITISLGGAEYPSDSGNARELIERADQALYAAKSGGRNRVVWYDQNTMKEKAGEKP